MMNYSIVKEKRLGQYLTNHPYPSRKDNPPRPSQREGERKEVGTVFLQTTPTPPLEKEGNELPWDRRRMSYLEKGGMESYFGKGGMESYLGKGGE